MIDTTYEQDVLINENRFDEEWLRQPSLMMKWSLKHATSVKRKARAEENLKIIRAEARRLIDKEKSKVDTDIRKYWKDYGFDSRPTENGIENAINGDKKFNEFCDAQEKRIKEAGDVLIDAVEEEAIYAAAVKAMVHRKKSLEELGEFIRLNLGSEPHLSNPAREEQVRRSREGTREMRESMRRKHHETD